MILAGMFAFFAVEKLVRLSTSGDDHGHSHSHSHSHSHGAAEPPKDTSSTSKTTKPAEEKKDEKKDEKRDEKKDEKKDKKDQKETKSAPKTEEPLVHEDEGVKPEKLIGGLLNLFADTAHNFTDGMAIAASFLTSYQVSAAKPSFCHSRFNISPPSLARNFHYSCCVFSRDSTRDWRLRHPDPIWLFQAAGYCGPGLHGHGRSPWYILWTRFQWD